MGWAVLPPPPGSVSVWQMSWPDVSRVTRHTWLCNAELSRWLSLQILAAPLAALTLALAPPQAFVTLAFYYFFGKIVCHVSRVTTADCSGDLVLAAVHGVGGAGARLHPLPHPRHLPLPREQPGRQPAPAGPAPRRQPRAPHRPLPRLARHHRPQWASHGCVGQSTYYYLSVCLLQAACFSSSRGSNSGGKIILIR